MGNGGSERGGFGGRGVEFREVGMNEEYYKNLMERVKVSNEEYKKVVFDQLQSCKSSLEFYNQQIEFWNKEMERVA